MHTNSPTNSQTRRQQAQQAPQRPGGSSQPPHPSPTTSQQLRSYSPEPLSRYGPTLPSPQSGISAAAPRNKSDQIIQNFYTKVAQVIIQARLTHHDGQPLILPQATTSTGSTASTRSVASNLGASKGGGTGGKKTNKWFNLEMDDLDLFKDELKYWRNMATTLVPSSATHPGTTPPPMIIELYLDTSELTQSQILVVTDETMRRNRVDLAGPGSRAPFVGGRYGGGNGGNGGHGQRSILLESWALTLNQPTPDPPPELPVVYKKSIIFFRSLYAYVRLLPAFRLQRRLRKMKGLASLRLGYRLVATPTVRNDEIPIDVPIVDSDSRPATSEYKFGSIDTPLGVFSLLVVYRHNCDFNAEDSERDLSSQFIDMDENYFKPTMVEYRKEQDSIERARKRTSLDERRLGLDSISGIGGERMVRGPSRGSKQSFTESLASQTFSASSGILGTPPSGQASAGLSAIYGQGSRPEATESTPILSVRNEEDSRGPLSQRSQRRVSLQSRGSSGSLSGSPPKGSVTSFHRVPSARSLAGDNTSVGLDDTGTPVMSSSPSSAMGPAAASSTFGRRPSIGIISPFKSPSFSSSPTQQEPIPTPSISGQRSGSSPSTLLQKSTSYSSLAHRSPPVLSRAPVPSSSTGRSTSQQPVPQFSSSFDRYRYGSERSSPTRDNIIGQNILARKPSRASVTSLNKLSDDGSDSSWITSQTDDDEVKNFVKLLDSHQSLNIFSKRSGTASRMTGSAMSGGLSDSMGSMTGSGVSPKLALSHFQAQRGAHDSLSESMTPDTLLVQSAESSITAASPTDRQANPVATSTSPGSSSLLSSQGRAHQPAVPSPLHAQAVPLPMQIPQESSLPHSPAHHSRSGALPTMSARSDQPPIQSASLDSRSSGNEFTENYSSFPDVHHQEPLPLHRSETRLRNQLQPRPLQHESEDIDNEGASRGSMPDDLFESSSTRPAHSDNPLSHPTQEATGTYSASSSAAALSSRMRRYPSSGGNSISSLNSARGGSQMARLGSGGSMNENSSSVLGNAAVNSTGARGGSVEYDDSLLFTMTELITEVSSNSPSAGPFGDSSIFGGPFALPTTGTSIGVASAQVGGAFGNYRNTAISSGGPFSIGAGVNSGSVTSAGFSGAFSRGTGMGEDMVRKGSAQGTGMGTLVEEEERSRSDSASSSDSLGRSGAASGRGLGTIITGGSRSGLTGSRTLPDEQRYGEDTESRGGSETQGKWGRHVD